jgi:capsular polysaccharide biosynthesis protein
VTKIKIDIPFNIDIQYKDVYSNYDTHTIPTQQTKEYKNVFLSYCGISLKNLMLLPRSLPNLSGKNDKTFYWDFWRQAIEQFIVCQYGKSLKFINLNDDSNYLMIYGKWFGYFSWITECLPRLLMVESNLPKYTLIYPEAWLSIPYVNESLKMFPEVKIKIIPADTHMFVKNMVLPESKKWTNIFNPIDTDKVRNYAWNYLNKNQINLDLGQRIYVSRKKALRRKIINENEIISYLENEGFQIICFEDYNFWDQVSIMRNTNTLISLHGAGLANINFMQKKSNVIELTKKPSESDIGRIPFWRLSNSLSLNYSVIFGAPKNNIDSYDSDLYINIKDLTNHLVNLNKY